MVTIVLDTLNDAPAVRLDGELLSLHTGADPLSGQGGVTVTTDLAPVSDEDLTALRATAEACGYEVRDDR